MVFILIRTFIIVCGDNRIISNAGKHEQGKAHTTAGQTTQSPAPQHNERVLTVARRAGHAAGRREVTGGYMVMVTRWAQSPSEELPESSAPKGMPDIVTRLILSPNLRNDLLNGDLGRGFDGAFGSGEPALVSRNFWSADLTLSPPATEPFGGSRHCCSLASVLPNASPPSLLRSVQKLSLSVVAPGPGLDLPGSFRLAVIRCSRSGLEVMSMMTIAVVLVDDAEGW